jgi:hypothetical protein
MDSSSAALEKAKVAGGEGDTEREESARGGEGDTVGAAITAAGADMKGSIAAAGEAIGPEEAKEPKSSSSSSSSSAAAS